MSPLAGSVGRGSFATERFNAPFAATGDVMDSDATVNQQGACYPAGSTTGFSSSSSSPTNKTPLL
jgi:hypothetical protein